MVPNGQSLAQNIWEIQQVIQVASAWYYLGGEGFAERTLLPFSTHSVGYRGECSCFPDTTLAVEQIYLR
jgi:hypothetical protein